ncbi:hypothetical protein TrRE_jg11118 [Triparma retinervis]|uniref:Wntless-like transmembrane domain-containing protein n=1 Tax=Triparma retinervis TaxID=2557542 RepID=A0A9W7ECG6_9STRA|nr:hypothetical protein TrRE_jg11118 [Triparma retinervis]
MENLAYGAVRIESAKFGKRGVCATAVCFFLAFSICCFVGMAGPDVFVTKSGIANLNVNRRGIETSVWNGNLIHLNPENQFLWLTCTLTRPDSIDPKLGFEYEQQLTLDVLGTDEEIQHAAFPTNFEVYLASKNVTRLVKFPPGAEKSDPITIFNMHSVQYENYKVKAEFLSPGHLLDEAGHASEVDHQLTAQFDLTYVNKEYTGFEMSWKYTFLVITVLAMWSPRLNRGGLLSRSRTFTSCSLVFEGFFTKLCGTSSKIWSYQQKWISVLLVMLFFFNDPLIYFEVYNTKVGGEVLGGIYIGLMALFITTLMLFWLCALDETRAQGSMSAAGSGRKKGCKKHGGKVAFLFTFWLYLVITYSYIRMQEKGDVSYEAVQEGDRFVAASVLGSLFMIAYALWFLFYTFRALAVIRNLPPPFLFIFLITFFTFAATVVGIFIAAMYPLPGAALDFLGMYSLYNLYIWTMAFVYAPLRSGGDSDGGSFGDFSMSVSSGEGDVMNDGGIGADDLDDMQL